MDFGRVDDVDKIDTSLPVDHAATLDVLGGTRAQKPSVYIGAPIWSHKGFVGKIYPASAKPNEYLHHYSRQFDCIELNSTFYGVQPASIPKWEASVPDHFRFCPKLPSLISHDLALVEARKPTEAFVDAILGLGKKLGPAWMNFPPRFGPDQLGALTDWLADWPTSVSLSIELRHPDWFRDRRCFDRLFEALRELDIGIVITDSPGRRDVLHQRLSTRRALVRFAGNLLHPSDFARLEAWADRVAAWIETGLEEIFFILHQPDESLTVELAQYFAEQLSKRVDVDVRAPTLIERFVQGELL